MSEGERDNKLSGISSYTDTDSIESGSQIMTSFILNNFPKGKISEYSHTRVRASAYEFWGDTNIQSRAPPINAFKV